MTKISVIETALFNSGTLIYQALQGAFTPFASLGRDGVERDGLIGALMNAHLALVRDGFRAIPKVVELQTELYEFATAAELLYSAKATFSLDLESNEKDRVVDVGVVTPTSGTRIVLRRTQEGVVVRVDFGPRGSTHRAEEIFRSWAESKLLAITMTYAE